MLLSISIVLKNNKPISESSLRRLRFFLCFGVISRKIRVNISLIEEVYLMTNHKKTEMINHFREQFAQKMHELGFEYNNIELYQQAFSHSSFINDFNMDRLDHNERLEF